MGKKVIVIREKTHTHTRSVPTSRPSLPPSREYDGEKTAFFVFWAIIGLLGFGFLTFLAIYFGDQAGGIAKDIWNVLKYLLGGVAVIALVMLVGAIGEACEKK
jgi:hypothetical protein